MGERKPRLPLISSKTGDTAQSVPSEFSRPIFGRFYLAYVWFSAWFKHYHVDGSRLNTDQELFLCKMLGTSKKHSMTAEVAVMNKAAVALAADSAATGRHKIYNSVNKLFQLSEHRPVGIMIFGSAEIMGVPWETVIKVYRMHLGARSESTLEEYGQKFITWLTHNNNLFPPSEHEAYVARSSASILEDLFTQCKYIPIPKGGTADGVLRDAVTQRFLTALVTHCRELHNLPPTFKSEIETKFGGMLEGMAREKFKKASPSAQTIEAIRNYCIECLSREFFIDYSGLVIAGFGEDDIFPNLVEYEIEGLAVTDFLKHRKKAEAKITFGMNVSISAFAQDEMVKSFMTGLHPFVNETLDAYLKEALSKYEEAILKNLRGKQKANLKGQLQKASEAFITEWGQQLQSHQRIRHIEPVIYAVENLPKDELAAMAESLVNLTVLKRRMSTDRETVGGPIDVAVISKGDGFIWIKRKHYFVKDLNLRYLNRPLPLPPP